MTMASAATRALAEDDDPLSRPLNLGSQRSLYKHLLLYSVILFCLPLVLLVHALLLPPLLLLFTSYSLLFHPALLSGLPRDISFVVRLVTATTHLKRRLSRSHGKFTTADYWRETVERNGPRDALLFEGNSWTYDQVDAESDRVAQWALNEGLQAGDSVALMCESNRPDYIFIWLGMAKAGISTTLLNGALRGASLQHALKQCDNRRVLFDAASADALALIATSTHNSASPASIYVCIDSTASANVTTASTPSSPVAAPTFARSLELPRASELAPELSAQLAARRADACHATHTLLHIFTSGTTGMPKAARLNHIRFFSAIVIPYMFGLRATDRFYCCLPMCHTAAVGSLSICWWLGAPLILARRFSASNFWRECAESRATVVQYVGELCRYLVHTPTSPHDRSHSVRVAFGNGLRPDVWPKFVRRFGVQQIAEVYASTEGNANLANTVGKEGAVGFVSPLLARMYPVRLVKLREMDGQGEGDGGGGGEGGGYGEPLRDASSGLCVRCRPGEVGELLGLVDQSDAARNFAGYTDPSATRKRLVRDVLRKGDCWFRTGDLMRCDAEGFVFFADRLGDTFRYKGENVSCAEVAAAIARTLPALRLQHCLVYGVQLPNLDGKVGMAAVLFEAGAPPPDLAALYDGLEHELPGYAQPRCLRVLHSESSIEMTHTFKARTTVLQAEGIEPKASGEVYVRDATQRTYRPLRRGEDVLRLL